MTNERIKILQNMPIFGGVKEDILRNLLKEACFVTMDKGDLFVKENDQGHSLFVLEEGEATVLKQWQGKFYNLATFGPGDCFGEMELINPCRRTASVRAATQCRAIELTNINLLGVYKSDIEQYMIIQMNMGREVCRRLRDLNEKQFQQHAANLTPESE